jgi:Tfp pilus assembly protein PilF
MALLASDGKDYAAADEFFAAAVSAEPRRKGNVLLVWGVNLLVADKVAEATKILQRGLNEQALPDDNPAFQFYLASALELAGRTDEALEQARKAAELRKDDPRFVGRVAWVQYHAKRYADAEESYRALLKKFDDSQTSEIREAMRDARAALSNINVIQHQVPQAEEWLEQILDEFPDNTGAMNDLGYLWADENKHLERALQMVRKAVKDDPKNMAYLDSLGWALYRLGRYPEAVVELKAAAAGEKPDATVLDHLGDAAAKAGDLPAARDAWRRALAGFEKDDEKEKAEATRKKLAGSPD